MVIVDEVHVDPVLSDFFEHFVVLIVVYKFGEVGEEKGSRVDEFKVPTWHL